MNHLIAWTAIGIVVSCAYMALIIGAGNLIDRIVYRIACRMTRRVK